MTLTIPRNRYVALFGPTTGDKIRLADTELIIEIEKDLLKYGDEVVFGGGKSARDGCGQASGVLSKDSLDLVITNAIVLDPILGIIKADIGVKDGLIVTVGNAGNPNVMDDIDMIISSNTEIISAGSCGQLFKPFMLIWENYSDIFFYTEDVSIFSGN